VAEVDARRAADTAFGAAAGFGDDRARSAAFADTGPAKCRSTAVVATASGPSRSTAVVATTSGPSRSATRSGGHASNHVHVRARARACGRCDAARATGTTR
jgi:hypothetical protein